MTRKDISKYVPGSGLARYKALRMLAWRPGRIRPDAEFEHEYPIVADPESYEVLEVIVEPQLVGGKAPEPAPVEEAPADLPSVDTVTESSEEAAPASPPKRKPRSRRRKKPTDEA